MSSLAFCLMTKDFFTVVTVETLESLCDNLASVYSDDLDGKQFCVEIIDCKMLISSRTNVKLSRPEDLLTFIVEYGDESAFPNLRITLQVLLTVAVFTASCERSFSKLKLILSYLRSSTSQERLCDLALLSIERDERRGMIERDKTNFDKVIDEFASRKTLKVLLSDPIMSGRPNFLLLIV